MRIFGMQTHKQTPPRFAIITPSYSRDIQRCRLLAQSIDLFVCGDFEHIIVVEQLDIPLFLDLIGPRRKLISRESVIDNSIFLPAPPPNGWILQQLIKLSAATFIDQPLFLFMDSDVVLIDYVSIDRFMRDCRISLFREVPSDFNSIERSLLASCARILRLKAPSNEFKYIWQLIVWRRDLLIELQSYVKSVWNTDNWLQVIASEEHPSEYNLYGIFADTILSDESRHYRDGSKIRCHCRWDRPFESETELKHFFSTVPPRCLSIMISSRINMNVTAYLHYIRSFWNRSLKV
jgi:hypothetical protein